MEEHKFLVEIFPDHPQLHEFHFRLALAEIELGYAQSGTDRLAIILRSSPGTNVGLQAESHLKKMLSLGTSPTPMDDTTRLNHGRYLKSERRWRDAEQWLSHAISVAKAEGKPVLFLTLKRELAAMHFAEEKYDKALILFRELWLETADDDLGRQIARCLQRKGLIDEAEAAHWKRLEAGGSRKAIIADIAEMFWWEGRYDKLLQLERKAGMPTQQNVWEEAWLLLRTGKHKDAAKRFLRYAQVFPKERHRATYWAGRATMEGGERTRGLNILERLMNEAPFGYYGLQAANRLYDAGRIPESIRQFPPSAWPKHGQKKASIHWWPNYERLPHGPMGGAYNEAKKRLEGTKQVPGPVKGTLDAIFFLADSGDTRSALQTLRHLIGARFELRKGTSLDTLIRRGPQLLFDNRPKARQTGLWGASPNTELPSHDEGRLKREAFLKSLVQLTPEMDSSLVELHVALGEWHFLGQEGRRRISPGKAPGEKTREAYRKNFPESYTAELEQAHRATGLQPDLVRSLMHVESRLNPLAISRSDARGLMQVLPRTGRLIARELGYREFGKELLLEPRVALHFGSWYLKELVKKFGGQEVLAVCSYNTGPFNVSYWLARKQDLPFDVFLEEVPWKQPREYVKKVLSNLQIYSWIRTGSNALYVSNGLDPSFKDNINF